jgi:lipid-A-disaccharide synthase-like uncharacterized protein
MSLVGSLLSLAYFVFGKNDLVGILAYVFPSVVSVYNLRLEFAQKRRLQEIADSESSNLESSRSPLRRA